MGPVFVILGWLIIAIAFVGAVAIAYLILHALSRRSPVAAQLKKVLPSFVAAIALTMALIALIGVINLLRVVFLQ